MTNFLLCCAASIAFFIGSSAALIDPITSNALASSLLVAYPSAAGSVLYTLGAQYYKKSALEGLQRARRKLGRLHPACTWARIEVRGEAPCNGSRLVGRVSITQVWV